VGAKVGIGSLILANQIKVITNINDIPAQVGYGPLADACADAFAEGARTLVVVGAPTAVPGAIESQTLTGPGPGQITLVGSPSNRFDIVVEITASGDAGTTAAFRYSLNGGASFSEPIAVPPPNFGTAEVALPGTGLTLQFQNAGSPSFDDEDRLVATTSAPEMSPAGAAAAIDALLASAFAFEWVHVVGESDGAMWTICQQRATTAAASARWVHFICEAVFPPLTGTTEAFNTWRDDLLDDAEAFQSDRVAVVAGWVRLSDPLAGQVVVRNAAGLYTGRLARIAPQRSPGAVIDGALPVLEIAPALYPPVTETLDTAGFVTVRRFANTQTARGVYFTRGRMMASNASDFVSVQNRRVMDKALWLVREVALPWLNTEAAPDASPSSLARFQSVLQVPIDAMVARGEIVSGQIVIPPGQNLLSTSTLEVLVQILPYGSLSFFEVKVGFQNPLIA
jgi:hypothetical protein